MRVRNEPDTVQLSKIRLKKRTHAAIESTATERRGTLNAEISRWLDMTVHDVELLDAVLALAFGDQNAAAVLAFGRILRDQAMFSAYGGPPHWSSDIGQFETVLLALRRWLEREMLQQHPSEGELDEERVKRYADVASMDERVSRALDNARTAAANAAGDEE